MQREEAVERINSLGKWYQTIKLDEGLSTPGTKDFGDPIWEMLKPLLPDIRNRWVLDVGCNAGCFSFHLEREGARVVGIDKGERWIDQALFVKQYFEEKEGRLLSVYFSPINLFFDDRVPNILNHMRESFHIVLANALIHHVKPLDKVARYLSDIATEMVITRLVKDKGRSDLIFTDEMKNLRWGVSYDGLVKSPKSKRYFMTYEKIR